MYGAWHFSGTPDRYAVTSVLHSSMFIVAWKRGGFRIGGRWSLVASTVMGCRVAFWGLLSMFSASDIVRSTSVTNVESEPESGESRKVAGSNSIYSSY